MKITISFDIDKETIRRLGLDREGNPNWKRRNVQTWAINLIESTLEDHMPVVDDNGEEIDYSYKQQDR